MNIFVFDRDINENVKMYCAKHTSKMILETAQLLSTAYRVLTGISAEDMSVYKENHLNHPCSIWARSSYGNYKYLIDLFYALHDEWNYKYQHSKIYKSYEIMDVIESIEPSLFPKQEQEEFVQCFDDKYKCDDPIDGYRKYFNEDKKHLFDWKNREIPEWIKI